MTTEPKILTDEQIVALCAGAHNSSDYHFTRAIEQAVLQSPEVQALRKDAGRYRWLRSAEPAPDLIIEDMYECALWGDDLDAAIDAAMEAKDE